LVRKSLGHLRGQFCVGNNLVGGVKNVAVGGVQMVTEVVGGGVSNVVGGMSYVSRMPWEAS